MASFLFATAIGVCEIRYEDEQLTAFRLPENEAALPLALPQHEPDWVRAVSERVLLHLRGSMQDFTGLPYAWDQVTTFQRTVYEGALLIKAGHTCSYGQLARAIGQPLHASRAVGVALGQNPWPLLVPCHRFIGADGRMTGFSGPGGIRTKLRLLALEGAELFADA